MKRWIDLLAHVLLGLIFFVFGLNGLLPAPFIQPPPLADPAAEFLGAMFETGYFLVFLKLVETVAGALLLARVFVPLALVALAPVVLNIFLFHLFLDPSGLPLAIVAMLLGIYLGFVVYMPAFRPMLKAKPLTVR